MFPSCLTRHDEISVVSAEHTCKHHEKEADDNEEHPSSLYVVKLLLLLSQIESSVSVPTSRDLKCTCKLHGLNEKEKPKFTMVKFADAATDPEAMVVELAYTTSTVFAMTGAERHHELTSIAESAIR